MSDTAQPKTYKESVWSKIVDRVDGAYDKFLRSSFVSAPSRESKEAWKEPVRIAPAAATQSPSAARATATVYWSSMSEAGKQANIQSTQTDLFQTAQRSPGLKM